MQTLIENGGSFKSDLWEWELSGSCWEMTDERSSSGLLAGG